MERRTACRWLWILDLIIRDFLQHWIGRIVGTLNSSKWFCLSWFRGCRIFCGDYFLNLATNCKIISHLINQLINNCFMCTADSSWSHLQLLPSQHAFLCVCMCDRLFYICVGSSHINMKYIFFLKELCAHFADWVLVLLCCVWARCEDHKCPWICSSHYSEQICSPGKSQRLVAQHVDEWIFKWGFFFFYRPEAIAWKLMKWNESVLLPHSKKVPVSTCSISVWSLRVLPVCVGSPTVQRHAG